MNGRWIPLANRKFKWKKTGWSRHYRQACPLCGEKKKNIMFHYGKYHPRWLERTLVLPLQSGRVGELSGVRFVETRRDGK